MCRFRSLLAVLVVSISLGSSSITFAQGNAPNVLEREAAAVAGRGRAHPAVTRAARARVHADALKSNRLTLPLFDDVTVVAKRTSSSHARAGSTVWHGKVEGPAEGTVTLALVEGVLAGSVTVDGRMFEIGYAGNGMHEVREVNPALFPTEDPPADALDLVSSSGSATSTSTTSSTAGDAAGQIDVMVVWTPAARNAVGGTTAAIQSLVDLSVANANASYAHSQIGTSLRLVYSGELNYTESNISTDLSRLANSDGSIDEVHALRNQYAADIVTLIGNGYVGAGACGIGYLMSSVSTSFAGSAFNVVDQSCAGGYLSYAHEVGHNQGLHHDPANAGGTPSFPYAYGYQDPGGAFRTVMSYGGATRVQQFSNPNVFYAGRPTGTASQDNARALNNNAATVANFRSSSSTPTCSYAVTPTSMTFTETGGTAIVDVATTSGCSWSTTSAASWMSVGPGGSGPGSVVVDVAPNTGSQRTGTATVAGRTVTISEEGAVPSCTYTVTPSSYSFTSDGGTFVVDVATAAGCSWESSSSESWLTVNGGGSGSGAVVVTAAPNTGRHSRSAAATIAGENVSVGQSSAGKVRGPKNRDKGR